MSDHDPFSDPFSPEPFRAGPAAPPPTTPPPPAAPRPAPFKPPPAPAPVGAPAKPAHLSPVTVFVGSFAFAGIAAVLLAAAIALLAALSDFHSSALVIVAVVVAVMAAAIVLWLGLFDDRGRRWARTATWVVCGLSVCAGVAVFVLEPGNSVSWFAQLAQLGAGLTIIVSVASALLLALPASNAFFQATPKTDLEPPKVVAPWTPSQPPAPHPQAPMAPPPAPDDDPFS